jgi:hypothetical protein
MVKKSSLSGGMFELNSLDNIAEYHEDVCFIIKKFYDSILRGEFNIGTLPEKLINLTIEEIEQLKNYYLIETETRSSFIVLTFIESVFMKHYQNRSKIKEKHRVLAQRYECIKNQSRPSLSDLFRAWEESYPEESKFFMNLKEVFKYRHWLAHGRYWTLKSQIRDFGDIYMLAEEVLELCE